MKVTIEPHNPEWALEFLRVRATFEQILENIPTTSIEHVGSTSIPGLKAKPVLDIDIIIPWPSLDETRAALVAAGYTDCGEMNVPGRFVFRQPGYGRFDPAHGKVNGKVRQNTYAMIEGCTALRNHLDIKRILMEDKELREEYSQIKTELAEREFENIGQYVLGKNEVLLKILRRAGWSDQDLEPVIKANS
ncbi:putative UPF0157 protein YqkA [Rhizodiscina lignyota]|uniref:UPF0157 protein YqkA n=1 Tax=Rhizodiscina lignyota TaxID=1504668 RepID=A0A9P4ICA4_9PEZI|nr:putative UPF0157 protein YqkA [Rhizodiscina lignyota]